MLLDYNLGILYLLAMSSLATYGILLAGWSANSKYAFLGSLRSTAQLISYELILSSAILLVVLLAGSLDITVIIEAQRAIWYIVPLFPIFIIFFIGSIAETNRAPFDLAEATLLFGLFKDYCMLETPLISLYRTTSRKYNLYYVIILRDYTWSFNVSIYIR
jgi:NADH-ubiquinone oxidoreductase chain 1